tara:strand:+ start:1435 stop:1638 length:204 start_codon:yes stop_codon:yes gene_type:complete
VEYSLFLILKIPPPVAAYATSSIYTMSLKSITEVSASHSPTLDCPMSSEKKKNISLFKLRMYFSSKL